ncbi:MAG: transcription elongation factor GreB [Gammaproteobacteria bacterium]|jgi:transcription elongation factor GreB
MSRWREPRPISSAYITPQGYSRLEVELKELWKRRAEVTLAVTAAAAEGDRSENAEYIYRKKELRSIDSRIGYLQKRMPDLTIVSSVNNDSQIFFGAWVTLEDDNSNQMRYRIVGADELSHGENRISLDSPLGSVLIGKSCDEEVNLNIGGRAQNYYIVAINYESEEE